jgi:hypothetical protein
MSAPIVPIIFRDLLSLSALLLYILKLLEETFVLPIVKEVAAITRVSLLVFQTQRNSGYYW